MTSQPTVLASILPTILEAVKMKLSLQSARSKRPSRYCTDLHTGTLQQQRRTRTRRLCSDKSVLHGSAHRDFAATKTDLHSGTLQRQTVAEYPLAYADGRDWRRTTRCFGSFWPCPNLSHTAAPIDQPRRLLRQRRVHIQRLHTHKSTIYPQSSVQGCHGDGGTAYL